MCRGMSFAPCTGMSGDARTVFPRKLDKHHIDWLHQFPVASIFCSIMVPGTCTLQAGHRDHPCQRGLNPIPKFCRLPFLRVYVPPEAVYASTAG